VAIAQQFGRPHTPKDQAWIETLCGHVKSECPHLEKIHDPGELKRELDRVRAEYNTVRLHAGIGYVTPDDEHTGRGEGIRQARRDGRTAARDARINYRRTTTEENRRSRPVPGRVFSPPDWFINSDTPQSGSRPARPYSTS
jgi:putative transposase